MTGPLSDDAPSSIVQQMPEVTTEALVDLGRMMADGLLHTVRQLAMRLYGEAQVYPCDDVKRMASEVLARRATEADLRAEVERLNLRLDDWQGRAAMAGRALAAVLAGKAVRNADEIISFCRTAALSPETDGGHDG